MKIDPLKIAKLNSSDYELLYACADEVYSGTESSVRPESFAALFILLRKIGIAVKSFNDCKLASVNLRGLKYTIDCLRVYSGL